MQPMSIGSPPSEVWLQLTKVAHPPLTLKKEDGIFNIALEEADAA